MKRLTAYLAIGFVVGHYRLAGAVSTHTYNLVQESIFFIVSLGCLVLAVSILISLKGGSLGTPWIFFVIGFAVAAVGGVIHLLDLFKILLHVYDLRLATLITTCGSMLFLAIGLYFYRRGLE
jgi:hypothetical protein